MRVQENFSPRVMVQILPHAQGLALPMYQTPGAAGLDLQAALEGGVTLQPGQRRLIPTGLAMAIPMGWEAQIRSRSGLALKHGVTVLNAPGTVDADYRGEVGVLLINLGTEPFEIHRGDRMAQMVFARVDQVEWQQVERLEESMRGSGGFGHTGR